MDAGVVLPAAPGGYPFCEAGDELGGGYTVLSVSFKKNRLGGWKPYGWVNDSDVPAGM